MTATLDGVAKRKVGEQSAEQRSAAVLVRLAKEQESTRSRQDASKFGGGQGRVLSIIGAR
jgi:hypothetical protein